MEADFLDLPPVTTWAATAILALAISGVLVSLLLLESSSLILAISGMRVIGVAESSNFLDCFMCDISPSLFQRLAFAALFAAISLFEICVKCHKIQ